MRACRDDERFSVEAARLNETVGSTPAIAIYSWLSLCWDSQYIEQFIRSHYPRKMQSCKKS